MAFIGFVLTLIAVYLAVVFVTPFTFLAGVVVAAGVVLVEFARSTAWVFRGTTAPIDHLGIEPRTPTGDERTPPEPAYISYYLGPVFRDYALAVRMAARAGWARCFGQPTSDPISPAAPQSLSRHLIERWLHIEMYVPMNPLASKAIAIGPLVGAVVGLAGGAATAAAIGAVISLVFGIAVILTVLVSFLVAGLLRLAELVVLRIRSITLECAACHHRVAMPIYVCQHCPEDDPAYHRRLVPGRYGVLSRICRCGNTLPTLLARKKYLLDSFCPDCSAKLPRKGMTAPTLHVPVVAGRQAGKTVFMTAAVAALERAQDRGFEFADRESLGEYKRIKEALRDSAFDEVKATVATQTALAFNIYLGTGASRRLMYLYDVGGERFERESGVDALSYLEHALGTVVIVDPFSFADVRRVAEQDILADVKPSIADTDEVLSRFAEGLRRSTDVRAGRRLGVRAAVVLTKCDALLRSGAVPHPFDQLGHAAAEPGSRTERSAAVREWLAGTAGQRGLLTALENTFERTDYFAVSARDAFDSAAQRSGRTRIDVRNDDPAMPLRWLLERRNRS